MNPLLILGWCREMRWGFVVIISLVVASAQTPDSNELQRVLNQMDQTAASFRTAQAGFVWDQYQKVVDDHDVQKGRCIFVVQETKFKWPPTSASPR
jgi:hypothetical protein